MTSTANETEPGFGIGQTMALFMMQLEQDVQRQLDFVVESKSVEWDLTLAELREAVEASTAKLTVTVRDQIHEVDGVRHKQLPALIQIAAHWLENQGVRVAITAIRATECSYTEILIKDHDQTLDINDVAVVSHGDFLRRILFRFDEHSETWESGYGSSMKLAKWMEQHPVRPEFNAELNVWIDNKASDKSIDADFDGLESWLEDRLGKSGLEPKKRYKAVLTKQEDLSEQMYQQIMNNRLLPPSFTLRMPGGGVPPGIQWKP